MLSRVQAELFISRLQVADKTSKYKVIVRDTAGDLNQQQLLQDMDGKDFFTKDIQDFLLSGEADFAVHSLKDVSSELFFKDSRYAIFSREDPRDVAIFSPEVKAKIAAGRPVRIGTSSPRRALMATRFLSHALPWIDGRQATVEAIPIRGNVDTRLTKLDAGQYDGIILAVAGLNRLSGHASSAASIKGLLEDKAIMVLPIIECPPAPGQGALVAETRPGHDEAASLLDAINDKSLAEATKKEREIAARYGAGCHQQFGVVHLDTSYISFTYGSGVSGEGTAFSVYNPYPAIETAGKKIFSSGDHMKAFFKYDHDVATDPLPATDAFFIAGHHAVHNSDVLKKVAEKRIWTAGTKTWIELAKKGLWVEGCADALGLEFIEHWLSGPLIGLSRKSITILTDEESAIRWKKDGWPASATYRVAVEETPELSGEISSADIVFWTSFRQYQVYRHRLKTGVVHCCPAGKTARLLLQAGIDPIVFPGIKGFNEWRKNNSRTATGE